MTRPSWLGRAVGNRHRHAIEQASRRWRGGRRGDSARTRRKIMISTQVVADGTRRCYCYRCRGRHRDAADRVRKTARRRGRRDAAIRPRIRSGSVPRARGLCSACVCGNAEARLSRGLRRRVARDGGSSSSSCCGSVSNFCIYAYVVRPDGVSSRARRAARAARTSRASPSVVRCALPSTRRAIISDSIIPAQHLAPPWEAGHDCCPCVLTDAMAT